MEEIKLRGTKHLSLKIEEPEQLALVCKALSSPIRLDIIKLLGEKCYNVNEIAEKLNLPMSSAALNIKVLEESGIITTEMQPGQRGAMKISSRRVDSVSMELVPLDHVSEASIVMSLPVGGYSEAGNIKPTCGLAGLHASIGMEDNPRTFYHSERLNAQLLWFRQGYVEYRFALDNLPDIDVEWLEISFEACSEAPMYRDPWKSDIAVSVNGVRLGVWTSPCDCGGRRGRLNPEWWSDVASQYGFLKTWRVDAKGSYLENLHLSDVTLADLALSQNDYIAVRIEVPEDAENVGGLNLFGEGFGDYQQNIVLRTGYRMKTSNKQE